MYDALEEIPIYVNPFLGVPENDTVLKPQKVHVLGSVTVSS
jgi:hypothetical protein